MSKLWNDIETVPDNTWVFLKLPHLNHPTMGVKRTKPKGRSKPGWSLLLSGNGNVHIGNTGIDISKAKWADAGYTDDSKC